MNDTTPAFDIVTEDVIDAMEIGRAVPPAAGDRMFSCPDCSGQTPHQRGSDECAAWSVPPAAGDPR
jgi:hypothetical protein